MPRRKTPRRYREAFSPEHPLPRGVEYIPYRHAVSQAKKRLQHAPLAYLILAIAWIAVGALELALGDPHQPVLVGGTIVSFAGFAIWNIYVIIRMRRGHPSGSVWRYGLFLWPDALVVLPGSGPVIVVPVASIDSISSGRETESTAAGIATGRVVRVGATSTSGDSVAITIDDLGAMPAPHLVRTLETWRTGVEPELLAAASTAGTSSKRQHRVHP